MNDEDVTRLLTAMGRLATALELLAVALTAVARNTAALPPSAPPALK